MEIAGQCDIFTKKDYKKHIVYDITNKQVMLKPW